MDNFDRAAETQYTMNGLLRFYKTGAFSDVTVTCGGHAFPCHKMVLVTRSEWFFQACAGRFREANSRIIVLQEDDRELVGAMLYFCYALDYDQPSADLPAVLFHVRMFALAEKYSVYGLTCLAADKFKKEAKNGADKAVLAEVVREAYDTISDEEGMFGRAIMEIMGHELETINLDG